MTRRTDLRLIHGGGAELPPLEVSTSHRSIHDLTHRVVAAAQTWTAHMIGSGAIERVDTGTERGRLTLNLTDAVTEYEWFGVSETPDAQGPVTSV